MCLGGISDAFQAVDKFANSVNPFKGITDFGTDNTLGKLPGIGKPLGQLADWGDSHPGEVGAAIGAAYGGAALLGADAAGGAAGLGADAGSLGAADGATSVAAEGAGAAATTTSGFGGVGTDAAVTAPAAGSGAASAAGGSGLAGFGKTALQVLGPAAASKLLAPKPPQTKAVSLMPDPLAEEQAARQRLLTQLATRGRASTILTSATNGSLGG